MPCQPHLDLAAQAEPPPLLDQVHVLQREGPRLPRALAEQVLQPEQLISRGPEVLLHRLPKQLRDPSLGIYQIK